MSQHYGALTASKAICVTQAELERYLVTVDATREAENLRKLITARLEAGAHVEAGPLSAQIMRETKSVAPLYGAGPPKTKTKRRLVIQDSRGQYLGWHQHWNG